MTKQKLEEAIELLPDTITMKREDVDDVVKCLEEILEAIRTGNIDSPWLAGEPEVGIPAHRWHEEWEYYAKEKLSTLTAALEEKK